jgi:hypothetical protein
MDALQNVQTHLENLDLPEGDYLILTNNLKIIYDELTKGEPYRFQYTYNPNDIITHIHNELMDVFHSEGLFQTTDWLIVELSEIKVKIILSIYNFAINPELTWKDFDEHIAPLFVVEENIAIENIRARQTDVKQRTVNLCFTFWNVVEHLTEEFYDNILLTKTGSKCSVFLKLLWKLPLIRNLDKSIDKDGLINIDSHFNKHIFSTTNIGTNESYHKLKVTINTAAQVFTGQPGQEQLINLVLHTKFIRLGGHSKTLEKLYNFVAYNMLLNNTATSTTIRHLKAISNYKLDILSKLHLDVSGITGPTRNQVRNYHCDFATVQYQTKLNNGIVI